MGKASRWFRNILCLGKNPHNTSSRQSPPLATNNKRKNQCSFIKYNGEKKHLKSRITRENPRKYDITDPDIAATMAAVEAAVAAANVAVAKASVAAAQADAAAAAAEVVADVVRIEIGLMNNKRTSFSKRKDEEIRAALKIQSAFRGYVARRKFRALKGLVNFQALVRGHIERKRFAKRVYQMQLLMRAHQHSRNTLGSSGGISVNHERAELGRNSSDRQVDERLWEQKGHSLGNNMVDDEKENYIFLDQINHSITNSKDSTAPQMVPTSPLKFSHNSNYTASTESSRSKATSPHGPIQRRSQFEKWNSTKGYSTHDIDDRRKVSSYPSYFSWLAEESPQHGCFQSALVKQVWFETCHPRMDTQGTSRFERWIGFWISKNSHSLSNIKILLRRSALVLWRIWKHRNERILDNMAPNRRSNQSQVSDQAAEQTNVGPFALETNTAARHQHSTVEDWKCRHSKCLTNRQQLGSLLLLEQILTENRCVRDREVQRSFVSSTLEAARQRSYSW